MTNSGDFVHLGVLIVDGRGQCNKLLRVILSALGVDRVVTQASAADALAALRLGSYDVVFCGEDNTDMNPVAFLRALRRDETSQNRAVPVILVSGHLQRRQVELLRDCGANDVLTTPTSAETVARKLRAIVLSPRPFVADEAFVGPDRRRSAEEEFEGKERRHATPRG